MIFSFAVLTGGSLDETMDLGWGEGTNAEVIKRQIKRARVVTELDKKRPSHAHRGLRKRFLACGRHNWRDDIFKIVSLSSVLRTSIKTRSCLRDRIPGSAAGTWRGAGERGRRRDSSADDLPHGPRFRSMTDEQRTRRDWTWG